MTALVRVGIAGFGLATNQVIAPLTDGSRFEVVGCGDPDPLSRNRFTDQFGAPAFETLDQLIETQRPDALYLATPTRLHEEMALAAIERGCHVLVEKPIASSLESAERMVVSARNAGVVLMVNHKRSMDRSIIGMWQLVHDGHLGRVRALQRWHFSDWYYRARAADERAPASGGVVLRQGVHEFDILRLLMPSVPSRLRGVTGDYDAKRPGEGAFQAWVECEDGTVATVIHNGYDHFQSEEFTAGLLPPGDIGVSRRRLRTSAPTDDAEHLLKRRDGHPRPASFTTDIFGFTLVNGEEADLRPAPGGGVFRYDEQGRQNLMADGPTGTAVLVDEFHKAVVEGQPPIHDGAWGLACLELCLAVRASAASRDTVELTRQGFVAPGTVERVIGRRVMSSRPDPEPDHAGPVGARAVIEGADK